MSPDILSVEQVADRWGVSVKLVMNMTRDGRLAFVPGVRPRRIPRRAVLALEEGSYAVPNGERNGQAPRQAPAPRGRNGCQNGCPRSHRSRGVHEKAGTAYRIRMESRGGRSDERE